MTATPTRPALTARTLLAAAALLTGAAVTGLAATASASATASSHPAAPGATIVSFTLRQTSNHTFELGRGSGVRVGFVQLSAADLMQGTRQLGHGAGNCVITRIGGGTADDQCTFTMVLPAGQIDLAGLATSTRSGPGPFQLAISGGTGRYAQARGYGLIKPGRSPMVTLHISG